MRVLLLYVSIIDLSLSLLSLAKVSLPLQNCFPFLSFPLGVCISGVVSILVTRPLIWWLFAPQWLWRSGCSVHPSSKYAFIMYWGTRVVGGSRGWRIECALGLTIWSWWDSRVGIRHPNGLPSFFRKWRSLPICLWGTKSPRFGSRVLTHAWWRTC
jgi:hypothetical protein